MTTRGDARSWLQLLASLEAGLATPASNGLLAAGVPPLDALPAERLANTDHVLLWLIDGFATAYLRHAPALREAQAAVLDAVRPTTTTTAIHSLLSGLPPAAHALLGWTLHSESRLAFQPLTARAVDWQHWRPEAVSSPAHAGETTAAQANDDPPATPRTSTDVPASPFALPPETFETLVAPPGPTFAERVAGAHASVPRPANARPRRVFHHAPAKIADTPYNLRLSRGACVLPFDTLDTLIEQTLACVRDCQARAETSYHYIYWSALDAAGHQYGPDDARVHAQVATLDAAYTELVRRLDASVGGEDVGLIVTADHGMTAVERAIDLATLELYRDLTRPLSGEPRLGFLHVRPGARAHFAERLRIAVPGARAWSAEDWHAAGGFGPAAHPHPQLVARAGDVIAEPPPGTWWIDSRAGACPRFRGAHGGLSDEERFVPLILAGNLAPTR